MQMVEETLTIQNKTGLHARPASDLSKLCNTFQSEIEIFAGGNTVNAKSIISILTAGIKRGTKITIHCTGQDEKGAIAAIGTFLKELRE